MDDDFEKIKKEKEIELKKNQNEIDEGLKRIKEYFRQKEIIFQNIFEEINKKVETLIHYVSQISKDINIKKYKFNERDWADFEIGMFVVEFEANIRSKNHLELLDTWSEKKKIEYLISIYEEGYSMMTGEKLTKDSIVLKLFRNHDLIRKEKINNFNFFFKETYKVMLDEFTNTLIKITPKNN